MNVMPVPDLISMISGVEAHVLTPRGMRPRGWVLVIPGASSSQTNPLPHPALQILADGGLGVIALTRPLTGDDVVAVAREMASRWGAPQVLIGIGAGASAAIEGTHRLASVGAMAVVGAGESGTRTLLEAVQAPMEARIRAADHFFLQEDDLEGAALLIVSWAGRHLPVTDGGTEAAAWTGPGVYRTRVQVRGHVGWSDEPRDLGGTDLGPTPFERVWEGLAACTTITLRMYADRKGWPLEDIGVRIEVTREGREVKAHRVLTLTGPLDEEQRARLAEIADRCPVHRALEHGVPVTTTLEAPEG